MTDQIREFVDAPGEIWDLPELKEFQDELDYYDDNSRSTSFENLLESGHDF
jgi:hypothetical protein